MGKEPDFWEIRRFIKEFEAANDNLYKLYQKEGVNFTSFLDVWELQNKLKELIINNYKKPYINVGPDLAIKLKKLFNKQYFVDELNLEFIDLTFDELSKDLDEQTIKANPVSDEYLEEDETLEILDILQDAGDAYEGIFENEGIPIEGTFESNLYDKINEIKRRRRNIGLIICSKELSNIFFDHLMEIKNCFTLGLYKASIIFCRAVIEYSLHLFLKKRKLINEYIDDNISNCLGIAKKQKYITYPQFMQATEIRNIANNLLHK
jgi:hypothetical protein